MMLRADLDAGVATHTGLQRSANEDDYLVLALPHGEAELFAIADGMGGAAGGAEASRSGLRGLAADLLAGPATAGPEQRLRSGFAAACRRVYQQSREVPTLRDMGSTLTAVLLQGRRAVVGHVGDTRLLLLRDGELRQITTDHAVREQESYLTRCIGGGQPDEQPDVSTLDLHHQDRLVLLTDGVWSTVAAEAVATVVAQKPAQAAAEELVRLANAAGGPDNASAMVLHCRFQGLATAPAPPRPLSLPRDELPRSAELGRGRPGLQGPFWPWLALLLLVASLAIAGLRLVWGIDAIAWLTGRLS